MDDRSVLIARRARGPVPLDAHLLDDVWKDAEWSASFVDMETGRPAVLDTTVAVLWDDEAMHVAFRVAEPFPRAELTDRDDLVFAENDVEVFVDFGDTYYELEINAANTVYEVAFVWQDAYLDGPWARDARFTLKSPDVYTFGGNFDRDPGTFWRGTHPRGIRYAFRNFDLEGLATAVWIDGVLNDDSVRSTGWHALMRLPWSGFASLAGDRVLPPRESDELAMFFGRFQQLEVGSQRVNPAWCLTPHGVYDTHQSERFTRVSFR